MTLKQQDISIQGSARRWAPGCLNAAGKGGPKTKFTKPGTQLSAGLCSAFSAMFVIQFSSYIFSLPTDSSKTPWTVDERGILCIILNSPRRRGYPANLSAASNMRSNVLTGQIGS